MTGRVAIVTGAGSGIGRATTRRLLDRGYRVALAGRQHSTLVETAAGDAGALCVVTDVRDPDSKLGTLATFTTPWGKPGLQWV